LPRIAAAAGRTASPPACRLAIQVARLLGAPESFAFHKPTRLIQVGESAGTDLTLPAASLRTSGVEIYGAARGMREAMDEVYAQIVAWTRSGDLTFTVQTVPLSDIASAWRRTDLRGQRLVVVP
jgi:NADPH:quinone reductase-like Zn-dependent oxidoreductase